MYYKAYNGTKQIFESKRNLSQDDVIDEIKNFSNSDFIASNDYSTDSYIQLFKTDSIDRILIKRDDEKGDIDKVFGEIIEDFSPDTTVIKY